MMSSVREHPSTTTCRSPCVWRAFTSAILLMALVPGVFAAEMPREEDPAIYADVPPPVAVRKVRVPAAPPPDERNRERPPGATWLADPGDDLPDPEALAETRVRDDNQLAGLLSSLLGLGAIAIVAMLFVHRYGRVPEPERETPGPNAKRFPVAGGSDTNPSTDRITFVSDDRRR